MAKRASLLTGAALTASVMIASCSAQPLNEPDTLRVAVLDNPTCLDPAQSGAFAQVAVARQVVDSLTYQVPDTGEIVPWLAESWDVNDNATEYTFKLKSGVTFSDNTPLNAEAVKLSLDADYKVASSAADVFTTYVSSEVIDDSTVKVTFSAPNVPFLQATSLPQLGIIAPAVVGGTAQERCGAASLIGSGPFVLDSFEPNSRLTFSQRADYNWPSSVATRTGPSGVKNLEIQIVPEAANRTGLLQQGAVDIITQVQPTDESALTDSDFSVIARSGPGIVPILYPNRDRQLLKDPAVQFAVQRGIDRNELQSTVLTDSYVRATSVLASSTAGWVDLSSELLYDPEGAKRTLDAAGWVVGPDGVRAKDGQRLTLDLHLVTDWIATGRDDIELVRQQLARIGVELTVAPLPIADWKTQFDSGQWDFFAGNLTRPDADVLRSFFSVDAQNLVNAEPGTELQELLIRQAAEVDPAVRNATVARIQELLLTEGYAYPLHEQPQVIATSKSVTGDLLDANSRPQFYDAQIQS